MVKPCGVVLFKRNFENEKDTTKLIRQLKNFCERENPILDIPFIVAIDEEGGRVSRLPPPFERGKPALFFSENKDKIGLKNQVTKQCEFAKKMGVNCFLAPVVDIFSEFKNEVIGDRSFGHDASTVIEYASLVVETLNQQNIYSCIKHFPGHGNTVSDTHKDTAVTLVDRENFYQRELKPFEYFVHQKIPMIMTSHVLVPCVDPNYPATLSHILLMDILRKQMNYEGYILSDDLRMNAIALHYKIQKQVESSITEDHAISGFQNFEYLKQASQDALKAGCDILLSCQSIELEISLFESIAEFISKSI